MQHTNCQRNNLSNYLRGNLAFTVLCLIAIGSGIAAFSLKNYHIKHRWMRTQCNYFDEKQALEYCFVAFKQLKQNLTKDTVITQVKEDKLYFIDAISQEHIRDFESTTVLENFATISIRTDPDNKQFIPCCFQTEGLRYALDVFFQQETLPEILTAKLFSQEQYSFSLIKKRWNSLKDSSSILNSELFEPYLKVYCKENTQIRLTFSNPFDRSFKAKYLLEIEEEGGSSISKKTLDYNCSLEPKGNSSQTLDVSSSKFNLIYGNEYVHHKKIDPTSARPSSRETPWRRPKIATTSEIADNIYFKTRTPLERLNACLFFHEKLEPSIAFGKADEKNKFFWNTIIFDPFADYCNLNAEEHQLKRQLNVIFKDLDSVSECLLVDLCKDILSRQPFYNAYTFISEMPENLAKYWNLLSNPPIFVVREECFIIEAQLKKAQGKTSIQCRLWVHREAISDKERKWVIDKVDYKHF